MLLRMESPWAPGTSPGASYVCWDKGCGVLWSPQWALVALRSTIVLLEGHGCPLLMCPTPQEPAGPAFRDALWAPCLPAYGHRPLPLLLDPTVPPLPLTAPCLSRAPWTPGGAPGWHPTFPRCPQTDTPQPGLLRGGHGQGRGCTQGGLALRGTWGGWGGHSSRGAARWGGGYGRDTPSPGLSTGGVRVGHSLPRANYGGQYGGDAPRG